MTNRFQMAQRFMCLVKSGTDNNEWAYTQYHGMNGYVPMGDLNPATRDEAIDKEYNTFGGKDVDFEVKFREMV